MRPNNDILGATNWRIMPNGRIYPQRNLKGVFHYGNHNNIAYILIMKSPDPKWDVLVVVTFEDGNRFFNQWSDRSVMYEDMRKRLKNGKWSPVEIVVQEENNYREYFTPKQMLERLENDRELER